MRAWRKQIGLQGPPPFDPELRWFDAEYDKAAERVYRKDARQAPQPSPYLASYREAAEYRDAWARERGLQDFAQFMGVKRREVLGRAEAA